MTSTSHIKSYVKEYYNDYDKCIKSQKIKKIQTNPRYKNFKQNIFHVGDEEQFQTFRDMTNSDLENTNITLENNLFKDFKFDFYEKYKNIDNNTILNTFRYMFHKFKKGIFVKIKDNKVVVFLPFSKSNFTNEWNKNIKINSSKYNSFTDFFRTLSKLSGRKFNEYFINKNINEWYGNNCLVRFEHPIKEGDNNILTFKNMFETLCNERKIPDMEFFLNRRDFPLLTKDETEPYNNIWGTKKKKLVSHNYEKYAPILSMSTTSRYADLLIPTWDDWARVQSFNNVYFLTKCKKYNKDFNTPWEDKKEIAIFRGGTTGCGNTLNTNMRLKISYLSTKSKLIDAGITNWNLRPRKMEKDIYLDIIDKNKLPFEKVDPVYPEEQSKYKYIIHIDGHVAAFRLSVELNMGSVILKQETEWNLWYLKLLKPYVHYVPIKNDLSDIEEQIIWCKNNDKECKIIAKNAKDFYNKYLSKESILDYLQNLLFKTKNFNGEYIYNYLSPFDAQVQLQHKKLNEKQYFPDFHMNNINSIPITSRSYGLLKGIELMINKVGNNFENIAIKGKEIFKNKLGSSNLYTLANFNFIVKQTNKISKIKENIHEAFIGKYVINELLNNIPNFCYTFGFYQKDDTFNVISEYIKGDTLLQYINSEEFSFKNYMSILIQISLSLQMAQNSIGFIHWDLTPWNIMIKKLEKEEIIHYVDSYNKIYRIKTNIMPIIIDYGKSHVIYQNRHFCNIKPYIKSNCVDILSLLYTSMSEIIKKRDLGLDTEYTFKLINFVSNTEYRKEIFRNFSDIKNFLKISKKYETLISSDYKDLENKRPIDFVIHINNISNYNLEFGTTQKYNTFLDKNNERQVFEYIYSPNIKDKINSYLNVFIRFKSCTIPQPNDLFFNYYSVQKLYNNLISVRSEFIRFCKNNNINNNNFIKFINDTLVFLSKIYTPKIKNIIPEKINYSINNLIKYNLDSNIYNDTDKFIEYINLGKIEDLTIYKEIIEYILLDNKRYKLSESHSKFYIEHFKDILQIDSFTVKFYNSHYNTLNIIGKTIYKKNLDKIKNKFYLNIYKNIISIL